MLFATGKAATCDWLKRLIAQHLREDPVFLAIVSNLLRFRYDRWRALPLGKRISYLPSALTGYAVTLLASHMAFRSLKQGSINYWPDTRSRGLKEFVQASSPTLRPSVFSPPQFNPSETKIIL